MVSIVLKIKNLYSKLFLQFYLYPKPEEVGATFITKSDDSAASNAQRRVSYTVNPDVKVILHWVEESLPTFNIRALGVRKYVTHDNGIMLIVINNFLNVKCRDKPLIVGFCLPEGVAEKSVESFLDFSFTDKNKDHSDINVADSLDALEADNSGLNTFIDTDKG